MSNVGFRIIVKQKDTHGDYKHHTIYAPTMNEAVNMATTVNTDAKIVFVQEMHGLYPQRFLDAVKMITYDPDTLK